MAKNAAATTVTMKLSELRIKHEFISSRFKENRKTWPVILGLKIRSVIKEMAKHADPFNETLTSIQEDEAKLIREIQEKFAVKGEDGEFVLADGNQLTFKDKDTESVFRNLRKEISVEFVAKYKELDTVLREEVEISALAIPQDLLPEEMEGDVIDALYDFIEQ
jgi:hypothetical protein